MKKFFIIAITAAILFTGCSLFDGTETYTVASRRTFYIEGEGNLVVPVFLVKQNGAQWDQVHVISGLQFEAGHEYRIEARSKRVSPDYYLNLELVNILSKEQKESEGLPKAIYDENWPPLYPGDSIDWSLYR